MITTSDGRLQDQSERSSSADILIPKLLIRLLTSVLLLLLLREIDRDVILYVNGVVGKWASLDRLFVVYLQMPSLKMLPIVTCLVFIWFNEGKSSDQRSMVGMALLGATVALVVSRLIQNFSSFRPRPMHAEGLGLVLPHSVWEGAFAEWSSFPSDTTALAFALAGGIWLFSKPLGWASLFWSAAFVGFPRIYGGFHYPSDIAAGALLGLSSTLICAHFYSRTELGNRLLTYKEQFPGLFYSFFFVLLFQITTMFDDVRRIRHGAVALLKSAWAVSF